MKFGELARNSPFATTPPPGDSRHPATLCIDSPADIQRHSSNQWIRHDGAEKALFIRNIFLPGHTGDSESEVAWGDRPDRQHFCEPDIRNSGEQSRITWSSTNATACVGTGNWSGEKPLSDSKNTRRLTNNETFTLTCTGPGGTASSHVTVVVTTGSTGSTAAPTVTISANPSTVTSGGKTTINWSASNATACTGSGAWSGSEALSGSRNTGALTTDLTFALTCTGAGGTASQSTTVSVASAPVSGYATLSWAAPTANTNGTPVSALAGYRLYYGKLASALTNSIVVSGGTTTSYKITGLTSGTWYFAVTAEAADGTESAQSAVGSKTI